MEQQHVLAEYRPEFRVCAEGKDITEALQQNLVELILTDHGGETAKADELQITLLSETLKLPSKGARLNIGLGFNGNILDKGVFVVNKVSSNGPPRKIVINATAAPMNAQKQKGNVQSQKTRSWDNIKLGDLVKTVAEDNGLKPKVAPQFADIMITHLDQVAESDGNLMSRLARAYNAVSKPCGGYWLFLEKGASMTASGKALPNVQVALSEVSTWTYNEGQRGASVGKPATGGQKAKGKIKVNYFNGFDGRIKTCEIDHDGPNVTSPYILPTKSQAEHQVKSKSTTAARIERDMNLTMPCRPKHIPLTAESRVNTVGFGEREDRAWQIESLAYTLNKSGLSVALKLVVDITHKPKTDKKSSAKPTNP